MQFLTKVKNLLTNYFQEQLMVSYDKIRQESKKLQNQSCNNSKKKGQGNFQDYEKSS